MDVLIVIAKSLGMSFGMCAVVLIVFLVGTLFWVRRTVQDRNYCLFLSENRQLRGKLHKPEADGTIIVGSGADAMKYLTAPSKQFWSAWPPGFPRWVQEPVPTLLYVAGNAEPLDPYDTTALITPASLRKISDEAMLKQTWKDVRDSLGIKAVGGGNTLMLVLIFVAIAASGTAAFLSISIMSSVDAIEKALGIGG